LHERGNAADQPALPKVDSVRALGQLQRMDAQRGIARRMVIGLPPEGLTPAWERDFEAFTPAGVIVFRRDFASLEALRQLTTRLRELARPRRLFLAIDEEGGHVSQLSGLLTVPPNAALLARGASAGDIAWASRVTGERLRSLGVDWVFAPVADLHSEPHNPVIGPRSFGVTAEAVTSAIGEALAGFDQAGIASCLKHFPGHGDTEIDSHLALPTCRADRDTLERREIAPFRAHASADAVMSAHVVYPALDAERPATFSRAIVHDLLRERLAFRGVCITDALEMKGATGDRDAAEAARLALEAGCDLLLFAFHDENVRRARLELAKWLVDGRIERTNFDASRPRLAEFDQRRAKPSAEELARPLESLTPAGWDERLSAIANRGLIVRDERVQLMRAAYERGGTCEVIEPAWPHGDSIAELLAREGVRVRGTAGTSGALAIEIISSRVPIAADALAALDARCATRPTIVVGLQNDAFLDSLAGAAARISAADSTPLTRRVVAARIASLLGARAGS
jgi:beta-glucosidase-like glycosyl hydrolase